MTKCKKRYGMTMAYFILHHYKQSLILWSKAEKRFKT